MSKHRDGDAIRSRLESDMDKFFKDGGKVEQVPITERRHDAKKWTAKPIDPKKAK